MALLSAVTVREDIPHEPGAWMEFRMLGWKDLKAARDARTMAALQMVRNIGPETLESVANRAAAAATESDSAVTPDALADYDQEELLRRGIAGWSYGKFKLDDVALLDEATATWAARRIAALNTPPAGDDRKNS